MWIPFQCVLLFFKKAFWWVLSFFLVVFHSFNISLSEKKIYLFKGESLGKQGITVLHTFLTHRFNRRGFITKCFYIIQVTKNIWKALRAMATTDQTEYTSSSSSKPYPNCVGLSKLSIHELVIFDNSACPGRIHGCFGHFKQ